MAGKPNTFDQCLEGIPADHRAALEKLRQTIHTIVPRAEECVSYGLAAFRLDGKPLVGLGSSKTHCAFYPMSGSIINELKDALKDYETSKGTIRFTVAKPMPVALVRRVIKARIAEIQATAEPKSSAKKARPAGTGSRSQRDPAVDELIKGLDHPLKREIEETRSIILKVSPTIQDGVKWNAPSFRTTEYFATINLRSRDSVQVILHFGAKVRKNLPKFTLDDPKGLARWLGKDRCIVDLGASKDFRSRRGSLASIVTQWLRVHDGK